MVPTRIVNFKHLWVECSYVIWPNSQFFKKKLFFVLINNELILTSMLAAGIRPDALA